MEQKSSARPEATDPPLCGETPSCKTVSACEENKTAALQIGQQELRDLSWRIGSRYPQPFRCEGISFLPVTAALGYLQWHVNDDTAAGHTGVAIYH